MSTMLKCFHSCLSEMENCMNTVSSIRTITNRSEKSSANFSNFFQNMLFGYQKRNFPLISQSLKPIKCQGDSKRFVPSSANHNYGSLKKEISRVNLKRRSLINIGIFSVIGLVFQNEAVALQAAGQSAIEDSVPLDFPDIDDESGVDGDSKSEPSEKASFAVDESFGFDGLGHGFESYAPGKIIALSQFSNKSLLYLGVEGYNAPLSISVGPAEALAILSAVGDGASTRPATHQSWLFSLEAVGWNVERVAITDFVDGKIFFGRVILSSSPTLSSLPSLLPSFTAIKQGQVKSEGDDAEKSFISIDVRPSDGIALALRCDAPLFVSKKVADEVISLLHFKTKLGKAMQA